MKNIAMLGSGFIARFYADSLQGYRNKDKIISVYSRTLSSADKFAETYKVAHVTQNMEESVAHDEVDIVCISLPNFLHEEAVMLCCKHKNFKLSYIRNLFNLLVHPVNIYQCQIHTM